MRVTVEFDDQKLADMMRLTGEEREDRAVALLVEESLMARRKRAFREDVLSGALRAEFPHFEKFDQPPGR